MLKKIILSLMALAGLTTCVIVTAPVAGRFYVKPGGNDAGLGGPFTPWGTIARANKLPPGSTVQLANGTYDHAPTAPGVYFLGSVQYPESVVVKPYAAFKGEHTRVAGVRFAGGAGFEGAASFNELRQCIIEKRFWMGGAADAAPESNLVTRSTLNVREFHAHSYGDDRDRRWPRIRGNNFEICQINVRPDPGTTSVLWRWSGVYGSTIDGCAIRLIQPDNGHSDDDASWKWLDCVDNAIRNTDVVFDHPADFYAPTGPFAPMWRDNSDRTRCERVSFIALRGSVWFSANTAGTEVCTCDGSTFVECDWYVPGSLYWHQCPPIGDTYTNCSIYAGTFVPYKAPKTMPGLSVAAYAAPPE